MQDIAVGDVDAIGAKLQQDPAIDYIVTLGAPIAMAALDAVDQAGSEAQVVTFDLNADAAAAIQDGRIQFSIDQQPYVQGYMSVASLWLYLTNGNDIGGGGRFSPARPSSTRRTSTSSSRSQRTTLAETARPGRAATPPGPGHPGAFMSTTATPTAAPTKEQRPPGPSLFTRVLGRPEVGALVAAIVIYIFFFAVAPTFRSAEAFSTILYGSSTSASSPSGWVC